MIHVDFGDGTPVLFDERKLEGPFTEITDTARERTVATEYRLLGRTVHRSVHVHLKEGLGLEALMGNLNG